jgi:Tol biopolymer transport system component
MPDLREVFQMSTQKVQPDRGFVDRQEFRQRRRMRNRKIGAYAMVAAIVAIAMVAIAVVRNGPTAPVPADDPTPTEGLGIFAPVAGRILYENYGFDQGYGGGFWAIDPSGPSDTAGGPMVADDVASTLVPLELDGEPLGWSSDGTELLLMRSTEGLLPDQYLSILHADGSETRLNKDPMGISDATISPDGTRVVFAGQYDLSGLYVIDAEGGRPVPLPIPQAGEGAGSPTFSPDGTQIAYLAGNGESQVWVANADGTEAHEILANEPTVFDGASGPEWSPSGDRLAIGLGDFKGSDGLAIYTFAPDGSDFTRVISDGISPYWSPDGSEIAYTIPCDEHPSASCPEGSLRRAQFDPQPGGSPAGLAIAGADGSNVREFGFAASGPWHPTGSLQEGGTG